MLLVVFVWSFVRSLDEGVVWAFIGGLIIGLFSGEPWGAHALALLVAATVAGQSWGQALGSSVIRLVLLSIVCVLMYHLVLPVSLAWTGYTVGWEYALSQVAWPSVVLNTALAPVVQQVLSWLDRRTSTESFRL